MERLPHSKARLIVNVMEHGTIVGTDDPGTLEFDDCVNAVEGLASWLGEALAEVNEEDGMEITAAILIDALHRWTFDEQVHEDDQEDEDDLADGESSDDDFPAN